MKIKFLFLFLFILAVGNRTFATPPDSTWPSNSEVLDAKIFTDTSLGAAQGGTFYNNHFYLYGDVDTVEPRVGLIREYTANLKPTGRKIVLTQNGLPIARHPTGLSFDSQYGALLGNTENKVGTLLLLDWNRALADGNLDHSLLRRVTDSMAVNGTRPVFISFQGKKYIVSADYGDKTPQLRLYDPEILLKSDSKGNLLIKKWSTGPYNQNIDYNPKSGNLTLIQNVVEGLGWRLTTLNLKKLLEGATSDTEQALVERKTFLPHSELEGYVRIPNGESLFITSSSTGNLVRGKEFVRNTSVESPAGESRLSVKQKAFQVVEIENCIEALGHVK